MQFPEDFGVRVDVRVHRNVAHGEVLAAIGCAHGRISTSVVVVRPSSRYGANAPASIQRRAENLRFAQQATRVAIGCVIGPVREVGSMQSEHSSLLTSTPTTTLAGTVHPHRPHRRDRHPPRRLARQARLPACRRHRWWHDRDDHGEGRAHRGDRPVEARRLPGVACRDQHHHHRLAQRQRVCPQPRRLAGDHRHRERGSAAAPRGPGRLPPAVRRATRGRF